MSAPSLTIAAAELPLLAEHLRRVLRLDRSAAVRLRSSPSGLVVWAWVLDVLVSYDVGGSTVPGGDLTVDGAGLATACGSPGAVAQRSGAQRSGAQRSGAQRSGAEPASTVPLPPRVDARWPGALPPAGGWRLLDEVPGDALAGIVRAGTETFRTVAPGAALPERVGTALLDHVALRVSGDAGEVGIPLRVLQALARTSLLDEAEAYRVEVTPTWYRLAGPRGAAHRRRGGSALTLTPAG